MEQAVPACPVGQVSEDKLAPPLPHSCSLSFRTHAYTRNDVRSTPLCEIICLTYQACTVSQDNLR